MTALMHWLGGSITVARWTVCVGTFCTLAVIALVVIVGGFLWLTSTWYRPDDE